MYICCSSIEALKTKRRLAPMEFLLAAKNTISDMSNVSFLEFQYKPSKNRFQQKPSQLFCPRDRQSSGLLPAFQPNLEEMRKIFDKFDSNKGGKISKDDYKATLRALGQDEMIAEVPKIFQVADLDRDGFIDFREFIEAQKQGGGIRTTDIHSAFWAFDSNGDGKISSEEIMAVLRWLGESCSQEDCERMVRAVDLDGDGMVNMDEFMNMMTRRSSNGLLAFSCMESFM